MKRLIDRSKSKRDIREIKHQESSISDSKLGVHEIFKNDMIMIQLIQSQQFNLQLHYLGHSRGPHQQMHTT